MARYLSVILLCLCGCASIKETHYFKEGPDSDPGRVTNYFRLTVDGKSSLSTSRYIAGYFDERAVDTYFSEVQTGQTQIKRFPVDSPPSKPGTAKEKGSDDSTVRPLDDANKGAFVMVLSTNAKSVIDTIGAFADNQLVADAIVSMVGRDAIKAKIQRDAGDAVDVARRQAVLDELTAYYDKLATLKTTAQLKQIVDTIDRLLGVLSEARDQTVNGASRRGREGERP